MFPYVLFGQDRRKDEGGMGIPSTRRVEGIGGMGFPSTRKGEGIGVQAYPLTREIDGATEG